MFNAIEKNTFEITQDDVRLDEIVMFYYGDLNMFDEVLVANRHLHTVLLKAGERVVLPVVKTIKVVDVLW